MTPDVENARVETFWVERKRLFGLAYRMLGSVAEAEDVVQDAYLRWHHADAAVASPAAFLATVVTRLSLDRLKQARHTRETYVGPWLPEPVVDEAPAEPDALALAHDVSVALMLALERLSPLERAAFLLHDVFDQDFDDVAAILRRSSQACRQLASRARARVKAAKPRFAVRAETGEQIAHAFFAASRSGDLSTLQRILAEDVVLHTDGGGRKVAALRLIEGQAKVCRFFAGLSRKPDAGPPRWSAFQRLNGLPGWITVERDGTLQTTALELEDGRIVHVYVVRNPDKLEHLRGLIPEEFRSSAPSPNG